MSEPQNNQFDLILPTPFVHKFLKFCYFIVALLLLGCGDDKSEKSNKETQSSEYKETPVTTTANTKTILCFGDSITAGYGLDDSNDAFPAVLQQKVDTLDLNYSVINSGLSGETSAGGKSRINWVLNQEISIFILELGANDGLRGIPLYETRSN